MTEIKRGRAEQEEAFNRYYAMGKNRSLKKLAEEVGLSLMTMKRWSSSLGWSDRIRYKDAMLAGKIEAKIDEAIVKSAADKQKFIYDILTKAREDFNNGLLRVKTINDLEKIMRISNDMEQKTLGEDLADNLTSLVEALKSSGYDDITDPDEEEQ